MATKFGMQLHLEELSQIKLIKQVLVTLSHQRSRKNISTTSVLMATKIGRMVTYLDGLLTAKSHDPLITWSCKIT